MSISFRCSHIKREHKKELTDYIVKSICELCLMADAVDIDRDTYIEMYLYMLNSLNETCTFKELNAIKGIK